jgi:N-acyl-D-amino-acid deacylase
MTGQTSDRFSLKGRGYIKEGYFGDITIFNEEKLKNTLPDQKKAFGIEKVFINGKLVLENGLLDKETLKTSGHAVKSISERRIK